MSMTMRFVDNTDPADPRKLSRCSGEGCEYVGSIMQESEDGRRWCAKHSPPDLLSIAGQLAEAARTISMCTGDDLSVDDPEAEWERARNGLRVALASWDAAMKGRK